MGIQACLQECAAAHAHQPFRVTGLGDWSSASPGQWAWLRAQHSEGRFTCYVLSHNHRTVAAGDSGEAAAQKAVLGVRLHPQQLEGRTTTPPPPLEPQGGSSNRVPRQLLRASQPGWLQDPFLGANLNFKRGSFTALRRERTRNCSPKHSILAPSCLTRLLAKLCLLAC